MRGLCHAAGDGWNHLVLGSGDRRALRSGLRPEGCWPSRQRRRLAFPLLAASPVACVRRSPTDVQAARCTGSVARGGAVCYNLPAMLRKAIFLSIAILSVSAVMVGAL